MTTINKDFADMTLDELRVEHRYWDDKISGARQWGAAVAAADSFRRGCERWIKRREAELTNTAGGSKT